MGLDMYVFAVPEGETYNGDATHQYEEVAYWRKHNCLHGWMERRFLEKGGKLEDSSLGYEGLHLTAQDIDQLEKDIDTSLLDRLAPVYGCFFGNGEYECHEGEDAEFIVNARAALAAGSTLVYIASW